MASDQLYLDKWALGHDLEILDIKARFTDYLIGNPGRPSYEAASKGVMGGQEEYSREKG